MFWATVDFNKFNLLFPVPNICVCSFKLYAGCIGIVTVTYAKNHNHYRFIDQLREVSSCLYTCKLSQICHQLILASISLVSYYPNRACTVVQNYLLSMLPNPFCNINTFHMQPVLRSHQIICNRCFPVEGSIMKLLQTDLYPDNGLMLCLQTPSHQWIFPLVEDTYDRLPHPSGKVLCREFCLLQANWCCAFSTTHLQRVITLTFCILFIIGNLT